MKFQFQWIALVSEIFLVARNLHKCQRKVSNQFTKVPLFRWILRCHCVTRGARVERTCFFRRNFVSDFEKVILQVYGCLGRKIVFFVFPKNVEFVRFLFTLSLKWHTTLRKGFFLVRPRLAQHEFDIRNQIFFFCETLNLAKQILKHKIFQVSPLRSF